MSLEKKRSGYSSYSLGRKNNNNSSIELNIYNDTVQLSDISCHKETRISLEIHQYKEKINEEENKE